MIDTLALAEVTFVLLAGGLLGLAAWAAHPRRLKVALPAGVGAVGLGLVGASAMPISGAALLLMCFAMASLAMEVFAAPGLLLHAAGAAVSLGVAGLCLDHPWTGAHPVLVVPVSLLVAGATWWAARTSWRARYNDPFGMSDRMLGREATVLDADGNVGHAVVAGQVWTIYSPDGPLHPGQPVRVIHHVGSRLTVRPRPDQSDGWWR